MPYSTVAGARSKVPALKNMSDKQVEAFISVYNALTREGKSEDEVFPLAISAAKRIEKSMSDDKKIDQIYSWLQKHFGGSSKDHVEVIKARDEELKQATHIVYQPNVPDLHGEWMSEETIRKACHSFNTHCRKANLFHMVETNDVDIIESYILPVDAVIGETEVKKGTWMAVLQYKDDDLWEMEKSGEIQGVSIGARGKRKEILKSFDAINKSNVNLEEFTELTDVNFEFDGAHLAVVHKEQGGAANGIHYALVTKSTKDITEEELDKIVEQDFQKAKVKMKLEEFLYFFQRLSVEEQDKLIRRYREMDEGRPEESFFEEEEIEYMKSTSPEDVQNLSDEQKLKIKLFQSDFEKGLLSGNSPEGEIEVGDQPVDKSKSTPIESKGESKNMSEIDIEKAFAESELYKSLQAEIEMFKAREEERKDKELKEAIKGFDFIGEDKVEVVAGVLKALDEEKQGALIEVLAKANQDIKEASENSEMFMQKSVSGEAEALSPSESLAEKVAKAIKGQ